MLKSDSERLEHIKECINSSTRLLTKKDALWLVNQAERRVELERKVNDLCELYQDRGQSAELCI